MRTILVAGLALMITVALNDCGYRKLQDDNWVYFEDWDMNGDLKLDRSEFVSGYVRDGLFKEDKARGTTASATAEESAKAIFVTCDENEDGFVTGLEFYHWEVNRDAPVKRDSSV